MADGDSPTALPEASILCPACRAELHPADFELHLRRAHHLYLYRGAPRPLAQALPILLDALLAPEPALDAWAVLIDLAGEEHGARANDFLVAALARGFARLPKQRRRPLAGPVGRLLAASGAATLLVALAKEDDPHARLLALTAIAHFRGALPAPLLRVLRPLLLDRRLPFAEQARAIAGVMRSTGKDGPVVEKMLARLVHGVGKARAIERLRELEERTGPSPAIDRLCSRLEENLRMSCPRCSVELHRPKMLEHLWEQHRLVLDGRRVRDAWALVEDWLEAYRAKPDPGLLERCRMVAERIDPEAGPPRLQRMLLARGLADPETRRALLEEARARHAARCPSCAALVPVPDSPPPYELIERPGRLSAKGYSVEVREGGLRTWLEVTRPDRRIYRGREPARRLTPKGARALIVGPLVLLALALAFLPDEYGDPLLPVGVALGLALMARVVVRASWRVESPLAERVRDYAWTLLAPRLHEDGFVPGDAAFLGGLAQMSFGARLSAPRANLLREALRRTEPAVHAGECPPVYLAVLRRLLIEDESAQGGDPIPRVVRQLARCFEGKLPMRYAQELLEEWECSWWTKGNLARFRVLLCDRAFEAGFEVRTLLDAGQTAPALGDALDLGNERGLAALRLLWSLRPTRPWDRCGESRTTFELAGDPDEEALFAEHPDVLLFQEQRAWKVAGDGGRGRMGPAEIMLTDEGVWLQEVRFAAPPRVVEIRAKSLSWELLMGEEVFRSSQDLSPLAEHVERWFRYAFHEFLPQVARVVAWKSPDRAAVLRSWGALACPECGRYLRGRVGEVGTALGD